jgi:hypothetical protein
MTQPKKLKTEIVSFSNINMRISFFIIVLFNLYACTNKQDNAATEKTTNINIEKAVADTTLKRNLLQIDSAKAFLQNGQLIMRSDDDYESLTLQNFSNTEKVYSHAGLLFKENDDHSMTGVENPEGVIRRDPYDSFVNPKRKTGFGLFSYKLSEKEKADLHTIIKKGYDDKIPFDMFFNLKTDDSLYCSEMIYKGLKKATKNRVNIPNSFIINFRPKIMGYKYNTAFLKRFEYIALDNLYLNQFCSPVKRVNFR